MTSFPSSPIGRPLRVAFLGTPPFAAECLRTLLHTPCLDVVGVVSIGDLVKETISEQQFQIAQLESYIMT